MNDSALLSTRPRGARDTWTPRADEEAPAAVDGAVEDPVRTRVERIVAIQDDAAYRDEVSAFLGEHRAQWRRIAVRLCRTHSVPAAAYADDVEAIVVETAWRMLERARDDRAFLRTMRSFLAIVVYTARPQVRSFVDHATAPASGMVAAQRRRRELARTRAELAALRGATPTVAEAVQATNSRLAEHRSDVVRQGMVVTEADELVLRGALSFDEALDTGRLVDTPADPPLHPVEVPSLVRSVVDAATAQGRVLGHVAALWMAEASDGSGEPPGHDTLVWIARTAGITRARAAEHIDRVREIAAQRLRAMGIDDEGSPHDDVGRWGALR
ncbi:hypothetical protein [Isoptericola sp. NPDC057391]|uniref:hypothetical protein n=1 Tax=Isoptericola sp. NPDC057391 TaxID=3346117 RepID=UPI00363FA209